MLDKKDIENLRKHHMEKLAEAVHNAWWKEKIQQGKTHPDMKPYNELSEQVKDLDRVAVESVLNAIQDIIDKENKE